MSRRIDETIEAEVGKFIDTYFWDKTDKQYQRITDIDLQVKGCDLSVGNTAIDEKVKYHNALNQTIEYPSVEIITKDRYGNYMDGWFIRNNMVTDRYMFISIGTDETEYSKINFNTINDLTVLLVDKDELTDWVEEELPISTLIYDAEFLRDTSDEYEKSRKKYSHRKFWLTYSPNLAEQPVNLVIPRSTLKSLSKSREIVISKNKIKRI